jgi:hypothetical protein
MRANLSESAFQQDMPTGKQGQQQLANNRFLPYDNGAQFLFQPLGHVNERRDIRLAGRLCSRFDGGKRGIAAVLRNHLFNVLNLRLFIFSCHTAMSALLS